MINFLSVEEFELCQAIQELDYGEIFDVEITESPKTVEWTMRASFEGLINLIRDGNQHLDSIKVHQGKPTQVQVSGEKGKLKYKKKIMLD